MTQEEINKKCLDYMQWIANIGNNLNVDLAMAMHFGAEDVDYALEDLKELKEGYELFWKADQSISDFEGLVREKRRKVSDGKEK